MDYNYYQKIVLVPLNIVLYNVFNSNGGPSLYGTEPWDFYLKNGFLNFNIGLLLALSALPLAMLKGKPSSIMYLSHFYLWFIIFSYQPHKEERFLYVVYPLVCLNASLGLFYASKFFNVKWLKSLVIKIFFTIFCVLSISRIMALVIYYRAPLILYQNLSNDLLQTSQPVNICVGSEWYRFPSHCIF